MFDVSLSTANNIATLDVLRLASAMYHSISCLSRFVSVDNEYKGNDMGTKCVRVTSYPRFRYGKWESVRTHLRSLPTG